MVTFFQRLNYDHHINLVAHSQVDVIAQVSYSL